MSSNARNLSNHNDDSTEAEQQLTVTQLIALLQTMPPDAKVFHEGCDCIGMASDVTFNEDDGSVMIVLGIVSKEAAQSRFWFQIIVGLAVLATIGNFQ